MRYLEISNKDNYESDRLWATSRDGTKIPISIVYKKGLVKNSKTPLLLYAYGHMGIACRQVFHLQN